LTNDLDRLANRLRAALDSDNPDRALIALGAEPDLIRRVPWQGNRPHKLAGLAVALTAGALNRSGRTGDVPAFLGTMADALIARNRGDDHEIHRFRLISLFPFLWYPAIAASIATQDYAAAMKATMDVSESMRVWPDRFDLADDPVVGPLLRHRAISRYDPFGIDCHWLLERQEEVLQAAALDRSLRKVYDFEELFLLNALRTKQPERAMPIIEGRGLSGGLPLAAVVDSACDSLELYAVCVLAAVGRFDEALALARALVASGYNGLSAFEVDVAGATINESLGPLSKTPAYQAFREQELRKDPFPAGDPTVNPLCALRDDVWQGKNKTRCGLSETWIMPGDPVVRARRLFGHSSGGDFDIARKDAFDRSGWTVARQQFETDTIPLALLFPKFHQREWDAPAIAVLHWEIARDPAAFDLGRAVGVIADHRPDTIMTTWMTGLYPQSRLYTWDPGIEPTVRDDGHGDAVNFTWRLLKAGFGPALFKEVAALPPAKADKVFAMLAMFDRTDCRRAAAEHFALPQLPDMMAAAFSERPSLDTHLAMADFADRHPRWRKALVDAMSAYALHLYSNYSPGADWFLEGLEHFSRARGCQLLYFLIHHPEDDEVLATMIEKEWLPRGDSGFRDAYGNANTFYYRTAMLNRMLHAPERLDFWLTSPLVTEYQKGRKDGEARRLVERWQKANAKGTKGALARQ